MGREAPSPRPTRGQGGLKAQGVPRRDFQQARLMKVGRERGGRAAPEALLSSEELGELETIPVHTIGT